MKNQRCTKCEQKQREATEALGLLTDTQGALLDANELLRLALTEVKCTGALYQRISEHLAGKPI